MKTIQLKGIAFLLLIICNYSFAQNTGIFKGSITSENGEPLISAQIALIDDNKIIGGAVTDYDGIFIIKEITPGKYSLRVSNMGYETKEIEGVDADPNQIAYVDVKLKISSTELDAVVIKESWEKPTVNPTYTTGSYISIEQIEQTPTPRGDIIALAAILTPAVMPTDDGQDLLMRGTRRGATAYYVDGVRTMEVPNVAGLTIANMQVLTGGIPAEYGDVSGGVVIITTKDYKWEMARKKIIKKEKEEAEQ